MSNSTLLKVKTQNHASLFLGFSPGHLRLDWLVSFLVCGPVLKVHTPEILQLFYFRLVLDSLVLQFAAVASVHQSWLSHMPSQEIF